MPLLILIRHIPTSATQERILLGDLNYAIDISSHRDKLANLINLMSRNDITAIYSSTRERSILTAKEVFPQKNIIIDKRLDGKGLGIWQGKKIETLSLQYPDGFDNDGNLLINAKPLNGESIDFFLNRIKAFINELRMSYQKTDKIAIFTHASVIVTMQYFFNADKDFSSLSIKGIEYLMPYYFAL